MAPTRPAVSSHSRFYEQARSQGRGAIGNKNLAEPAENGIHGSVRGVYQHPRGVYVYLPLGSPT